MQSEEERERFVTRLRDGASKAFLEAYQNGIGDLNGLENERLLEFFLIEKAAYEVIYEAQNRPTWVSIPLQGLHRLVTRIVSKGKSA
jgi:maltose alpha-D-glucosyltransferase/alpha-amylase